jgi:putative membrane protein
MNDDMSLAADRTSLMNASGAEFDRMYMKMMVKDHEKAVALFTSASQSEDAEVKSFAAKTLPALKMHLTHAQSISNKLGN